MAEQFKIENEFFSIQITSLGAEIKRIFAKVWNRELLWVPEGETALNIWKRTSPILFPIVGKLKDDSYHLKGKIYQMPQHGFARDKNFKILARESSVIEFVLEADQETFRLYPFCFELRVKYKLEGKKLITLYSVKNTDRQDIYFSIGSHPAFVTERIEDYEIHFEKRESGYFQLSDGLVNWENEYKLESDIIRPTKELFSSDALIFKDLKSQYIDLVDQKRQEVIRISGTDTPYLGIWAKDSVPFICIEPWYGVSDDKSHDKELEKKRGIQMLKMGESSDFSYTIELVKLDEV